MKQAAIEKLSSYGKVWSYDDRPIRQMFASVGRIEIEEKIDGSQFSFGVVNGQLRMRSKGCEVFVGCDGMFSRAADTADRLFQSGRLPENHIFRCEFLSKPKHNTLCYDRVPKDHLALYEVEADGRGNLDHSLVVQVANVLGLEATPLIYSGPLLARDEIEKLLERDSFLGGQKIEGVVIKARGMRHLQDGKMLKAKVVSASFKERHSKDWKVKNPNQNDIVESIGSSLDTPARYQKAVQHLRDSGRLESSLRDIGPLMKELGSDLHAEQAEKIKDELFRFFWPKIQRRANRGFVEWYKSELAREASE